MSAIHLETERVRETLQMLDQKTLELEQAFRKLRSASQRLAAAWQAGDRSERFQRQLEALLRQFDMRAQELQMLIRRAAREVQEWEEVDQRFSAFARRMDQPLTAAALGPAVLYSRPAGSKEFKWFHYNAAALELSLKSADRPYRNLGSPLVRYQL